MKRLASSLIVVALSVGALLAAADSASARVIDIGTTPKKPHAVSAATAITRPQPPSVFS